MKPVDDKYLRKTEYVTQKSKIIPKHLRVKWGLIILPQGKIKIGAPQAGHLVQSQLTT